MIVSITLISAGEVVEKYMLKVGLHIKGGLAKV